MSMDAIMERLPGHAKDLKLNYSSLVRQNQELTPQQLWGTVVASAVAARNEELTAAALEESAKHISDQEVEAAKTAAALMGMNNVFYRFKHLSSNEKYGTMPTRLRMNGMRTHGAEQLDFELWCLAVSAINGCGACVDSHEKVLREKGVSEETVLAAVRVAAVIGALGPVLDAAKVQQAEAVPA